MTESLKILYLEDDDLDAEIIKNKLHDEGLKCIITRASCKKEYKSKILENHYDVIIADHSLPDYDGLSALNYAKEHKPKIPFIFVSGSIGEERAIELLRSGAKDYVLKHHLNKLAPAIQRVINEVKNENAVIESENKYHSFFENSMDAIMLTTTGGGIVSANPSACNLFGYSESELIKLGRSGIVDIADPQLPILLLKRILTGKAQGELTFIRKDESRFHAEVSSAVFRDQKGLEFTSMIIRDITERKKMETDLSVAADMAKIGYWEYNVDSGEFLFNDSYYRLIHNSSTEKQGGNKMTAEEFAERLVHPDDSYIIAKSLKEAIESEDPDYICIQEARVFRDDGSIANVAVQFKVLKDSSGCIYKIYGINQDITERKRAEEELILAKEKAEKADKLKTEFLGQISHEIRSPMNAIIGFADLIKEDMKGEMTPDIKEYFEGIATAGQRLIRTVDLILNSSELQIGSYQPVFEEFNLLGEIQQNMINTFCAAMKKKGLKYNFISTVNKALVYGDQYSIHQIFINLIDNAVKYTQKGSISVIIEKSGQSIIVRIEDTGIGMSEEFMTKMYQPFWQEERGYSRRFDGNGLGLSLVKKYCELNGIKIEVMSKKGTGTKFTLIFGKE